MNLFMFVVFGVGFYISLRLSYEVWFFPEKYRDRIDGERKLAKTILGFSYWKEGRINFAIVKPVSVLLLLVCLLGVVISITGPIVIVR